MSSFEVEFGYKGCEKGWNLQMTLQEYDKIRCDPVDAIPPGEVLCPDCEFLAVPKQVAGQSYCDNCGSNVTAVCRKQTSHCNKCQTKFPFLPTSLRHKCGQCSEGIIVHDDPDLEAEALKEPNLVLAIRPTGEIITPVTGAPDGIHPSPALLQAIASLPPYNPVVLHDDSDDVPIEQDLPQDEDQIFVNMLACQIAVYHRQDPDQPIPDSGSPDRAWMYYKEDARLFLALVKKIGPVGP